MSKTTETTAKPLELSASARLGATAGAAVDGHNDLVNGWRAARNPAVVEHRAAQNQAQLDGYIATLLAE